MMRSMTGRHIIGWSEFIGFPDWGIDGVKAKIDTGARTSALHVEDIELLDDGRAGFHVVYGTRRNPRTTHVVAPIVKWARVRSSNGHFQKRCFVKTTMRLGPVAKEIEISLVSRENMLFRMLLGRKALNGDFLVATGRRNMLSGRPRRNQPEPKGI